MNIGVSPAYYISKYGTEFTLNNFVASMEWLSDNGFTNLQLEIFHYEQLKQWNYINCKKLLNALSKNNMNVSQFVAHFLMEMFESEENLLSIEGLNELEFIIIMLKYFSFTGTVTIPLPRFNGDKNCEVIQLLYDHKLQQIDTLANNYEIEIALEPQPESLAVDLKFLDKFENIGLNLDPGHLLCSGIDPFNLDKKILSRVKATHLCENCGKENLSLAPGTFNNNWSKLVCDLKDAGYKGSFDIEIICTQDEVENQYKKAHFFLKENCIQNKVYIKEISYE